MNVLGISWVGVRAEKDGECHRFFEQILGVHATSQKADFSVYRLASGDTIELFGPEAELSEPKQFDRNKVVAGLLVDDIDAARSELQAAGVELLGVLAQSPDGYAWQHFRGPDGNVWELTFDPDHPLLRRREP